MMAGRQPARAIGINKKRNYAIVRLWAALAGAAALLLAMCSPVFAATTSAPPYSFPTTQCAGDRYASLNNGQDLGNGCTAKDVNITGLAVVGDTTSCVGGSTIPLDFAVSLNFATDDRYDVGVFLANDGKDPKLSSANGGAKSCSVAVLPTSSPFLDLDSGIQNSPPGWLATDGNYYIDTCGDGNKTIGGGTGNGILYMTNVKVACQSKAGASGKLYVPFVVTWDNQASPSGSICQSNANPYPNTTSKCNSPDITQGSVEVVVLPAISNSDGLTYVTTGTKTSYSVVITNATGADLTNAAVFTDPAVSHLAVASVSCSTTSGGATCPAASGVTVSAMQGAGITIPTLPNGSSITFTVTGTLSGSPPDTITNTAAVSVSGQSNSASDTDTFYSGSLTLSPSTLSKNAAAGNTVVYSYTVYNFGSTSDTVSLSAQSANGWTTTLSDSSLSVPPASGGTPGSATFTVTVNVPAGTALGTADTVTIGAVSGNNPADTATASAITTVSGLLTFTPDNNGSGGAGAAVYYNHTVQNNFSSQQTVSFNSSISTIAGNSCSGWSVGLYQSDKVTELPKDSSGNYYVTLAGNGGSASVVTRITIPVTAQPNDECLVTTTASANGYSAMVKDDTKVKNIILYSDPGYSNESYIYPGGNSVYARAYGLDDGDQYYFTWTDPSGTLQRTSPPTTAFGTSAPDTFVPSTMNSPPELEGKWETDVYHCTAFTGSGKNQVCDTSKGTFFTKTYFYVGPDHIDAGYSGGTPPVNTNAVVDLSLRDINDKIPFDANGNLVKANPPTTKDPLMITVTVSGSAHIVATTLSNAVISGQTVTGRLSDTTGTAMVTISDSVMETVTVTPHTYNGALYGSPARDKYATITYIAALDHILLQSSGSGVTCEPAPVTLEACQDPQCTALSTMPVTVTLSPASGWTSSPNGATLTSFTFTGSTTVWLSSTAAQTVTLGTSSVSPAPTGSSPQCSPAGCGLTFSDAGFIISDSANGNQVNVPTQVAGKNSATYYLRAVKKGTTSQACAPALSNVTQTINMGYECDNPATCYGANEMIVNGSSPVTIQRNDGGSTTLNYSPVSMAFDSAGNAPFTLHYTDVGQIELHAQATVNGAQLTGASKAFVVKPDHFSLSSSTITCLGGASYGTTNPGTSVATGNTFCQAGEPFSVQVTAKNAQGGTTPSFGQESTHETVTLANNLILPSGSGVDTGSLTLADNSPAVVGNGATDVDSGTFSNGVATAKVAWNEVGIITLTPSLTSGDYLATGGNVAGNTSGNVGRFYPEQFIIAPPATATNMATAACGTFTYAGLATAGSSKTGQPFIISGTVTAAALNGATTQNYEGSFDKLTSQTGFGLTWSPVVTAGTPGTLNVPLSSLTMTKGVGQFTISNATYAFPSEGVPQDMQIKVSAKDGDGVTGTLTDTNPINYRIGRLTLNNADGSELAPLPMPIQTEYYGSNGYYQLNTEDSCTALSVGSDLQLRNPQTASGAWQSGTATMTIGNGSTAITSTSPVNFSKGQASLLFSAPGGNNTGYVDVQTLLGIDLPWLLSDWYGDTTFSSNPKGRVTFGIYQGNPKDIYIREIY